MNCASEEDVGFAQQADRLLVLRHFGFLVEAVQLQLRSGFGAEAHVHEAGLRHILRSSRSR